MRLIPREPNTPGPEHKMLRPPHAVPRVVQLYLAATLVAAVAEAVVWWPHSGGIGLIVGGAIYLALALLFVDGLMWRSWKAWTVLLAVQLLFIPFEINFPDPIRTVLFVDDGVKAVLLLNPWMLRWIWKRPLGPIKLTLIEVDDG